MGGLEIARACLPVLRGWLIVGLLISQNACLNTGARNSSPLPKFTSVALVNKGATDELKKRFSAPLEGSTVDAGIVAGTAAGAGAAVAAQASIACTYLVFVCAIVLVPAGALIGAVGGSVADSADEPLKGLSNEQILALERQFAKVSQQRILNEDIEENMVAKIPSERMAHPSMADALLQFRLYDIRFTKTSVRKYALTLKSVILFKWDRKRPQPSSSHRTYQYTSRSMPIEQWIRNDGMTMNQAFDTCIDGLVNEMLKDIHFDEP